MNWLESFSLMFFSISMFVNGSLFIPQIIKILRKKSAESLALSMFLGFNVIQSSIILHAYFQKDWVLMLGVSYSFCTCGTVTGLILYHKYKNRC